MPLLQSREEHLSQYPKIEIAVDDEGSDENEVKENLDDLRNDEDHEEEEKKMQRKDLTQRKKTRKTRKTRIKASNYG